MALFGLKAVRCSVVTVGPPDVRVDIQLHYPEEVVRWQEGHRGAAEVTRNDLGRCVLVLPYHVCGKIKCSITITTPIQ